MSAAPQFPQEYGPEDRFGQQPPAPPRRPVWRRVLLWVGVGVTVFLLVATVGLYLLVHNRHFQSYALGILRRNISASLGADVRYQAFNISFSGINPTLDLYGVVIDGGAPYNTPPLLDVQHVRVGVEVESILRGNWYLTEMVFDHPVAHVIVGPTGSDNLPNSNSSSSSSSGNIFDLGIRHAVLNQGQLYYNDQKSAMEADLQNLELRAQFHPSDRSYMGKVSYDNGELRMANYRPIDHSFRAQFVVSPTEFVLKDGILRSGASDFVLNGTLTDFSHPKVTASYQATINGGEFRSILKNDSIPVGIIDLTGSLTYAGPSNAVSLQAVGLSGTLHSRELVVRTPKFSGPIQDFNAKYVVENGSLTVPQLTARLLGGELKGTLTVREITGSQQSRLRASLNGVAISRLRTLLNAPALANVRGKASADVTATWGKSFSNLNVNAEVNINSSVTPNTTAALTPPQFRSQTEARIEPASLTFRSGCVRLLKTAFPQNGSDGQSNSADASGAAGKNSIPVTGHIQLHYSSKSKQVTLSNSYIKTPNTTVTLNGSLNSKTGMAINMSHVDLHHLESLASVFSTSAKPVLPPDLSGIASFNGTIRGTTSAPRLTGLLVISNMSFRGARFSLLRTNVDISSAHVGLGKGLLQQDAGGTATFDLTAELHRWSFEKDSTFSGTLNAKQLDVGSLSKATNLPTPISGTLSATVRAHGTEEAAVGTAQLRLRQAQIGGQAVRLLQLQAKSRDNAVQANLTVTLPAGSTTASGTYFLKQQTYNVILKAAGIQLGQLAAVRSMGLSGVVNANASGSGDIHNPQLTATIEIPKLQIKDEPIQNVTVQTNIANHVANVSLGSQVMNTSITGRATVNLTGDYETTASVNTPKIPLQPLVAAYAPAEAADITGQTELHADIHGPLKNAKQIAAHVVIPTLTFNYKDAVHIQAPQPIHIDYLDGVLNIQRSALTGTDTDLQFQGRVPVTDKAAPSSLLLLGTVNLKLVQLFVPDVVTSGELRFDINSFGQLANPNVQGQIHVVDAAFATGGMPIGISQGNGVLTVTRDRLDITQLTGQVGGGTISASGGILFRPNLEFDVAVQGRSIRLLYPAGVRSGIGGNLFLSGTTENALLRGNVNLYQLSFTPTFDLTQLIGEFSGTTEPPPAQGFSNNLQLNIAVRSPNGISLENRQLSVSGSTNLTVKGTAAEPVVLGRVNVTGGDLLFNNDRFVLEGGTIDFANPTVTEPVLNMSVSTTVQQYRIAMRFEGPLDQMRTSYTSDPALPPADIIHLLAFGNTTEAAAANPALAPNLAAEQQVASAVSSQVTSRVARVAGISQLSIDPTLGGPGTEASPGAVITVQQRVTSKIYVTFSTNVTTTQDQVIQLLYQQSPRLSYSGTRDQNGGIAFDTQIQKSW